MYLVLGLAAWCHISRVQRIFDDAELLKIEPRNFISMALNSICFMGRRPNSSMQTTVVAPDNNNQDCVIMEGGEINDISCTDHSKAFICQKRGKQVYKQVLLLDQVRVDFKQ